MAQAGPEGKALILLVTFFPQCVVSMLSMTPPVMANQLAGSLGLPPQIAGVYVGLVYACAILSSSSSASLITRLGPLRTSFACVVTGGAGLALLAVPHVAASLLATVIIGLSYGPLTPASSHVLARYRSGAGIWFRCARPACRWAAYSPASSRRRSFSDWTGTQPAHRSMLKFQIFLARSLRNHQPPASIISDSRRFFEPAITQYRSKS